MHNGLTSRQAIDRLKQYGLNVIVQGGGKSLIRVFFEQFTSFLILLLLIASGISFVIGEYLDGALILAIVILNSLFEIFQQYKADGAVSALKDLTISNIRVIRDGVEKELDSRYLVPGDVIIIEEGVKLPADSKILKSVHLEMNEAALTGESMPVVKAVGDEIFMGTIVSKGRAIVEVYKVGMSTRFGQIAKELSTVEDTKTPLQIKLEHITEIIGIVGIAISLIVFLLSSLQGNGYFPSFLLAVSLAVAVVPESLPAVMTTILSVGVGRLAKKKAIVRRLSSIEALGNTTILATDKTGTLTENKMNVKKIWADDKEFDTSEFNKIKYSDDNTFNKAIVTGLICNTATLVEKHDHGHEFAVLGDPTEGALLLLGKKQGFDLEFVRKQWKILDELSFDSVTKRMSIIAKNEDKIVTYSKGAPHAILEISGKIMKGNKENIFTDRMKEEVHLLSDKWASQGFRVLALGFAHGKSTEKNPASHVFLGLVAIHDPPRPEVKISIEKAISAGIKVVMITGDNEHTAENIGVQIGLVKHGDIIVKGDQIDSYSDEELLKLIPHAKIFARTTPFHKSRIVKLYQQLGEVVTVTGDGVNDAIALKQADVGVAMGRVGTDVARETADLVITDDNFVTIVNAIEEGRNIVLRLKNSIKYLLTGNLSEALSLVIALLLGFPPIFLPIQLLYINLISDGVPALAFSFSQGSELVMRTKPSNKLEILGPRDYRFIFYVGLVCSLIVVGAYKYIGGGDELRQQTAAFSIIAMIQVFVFIYIWLAQHNFRFEKSIVFNKAFLITLSIPIIGQYVIVKTTIIADIFKVATVTNFDFLTYVLLSVLIFFLIRFMKMAVRI